MRQQGQHIVVPQGDAAIRRREIFPRHMQKDRAAGAGYGRRVIVAEHEDDVVHPVVAPERFMARRVWPLDRPIVVGVVRIIAPSVIGLDRRDR